MPSKTYNRPDEAAMQRVLQRYKDCSVECVIRLAWTMGLSVGEIISLKWSDISFDTKEIVLSNRRIPMDEEMQICLKTRHRRSMALKIEFVITSDKTREPMHRVSVSRAVRTVLDMEESLCSITLVDLREDYIIRLLEQYDLPYVAKITGMKQRSLLMSYSEYIDRTEKPRRGLNIKKVEEVEDYEYKLWVLTQNAGTSPEGMATWMIWQLGMKLDDVANLTWNQVNFDEKTILVGESWIPMGAILERRLRQLHESQKSEADRHVLLTPKSRRGFRMDRLSRITGEILTQNGLENVDLGKLGRLKEQQRKETLLMDSAKGKGYITAVEATEILQTSLCAARNQLKKLEQSGLLTPIGVRYYLMDTVVPAEKHEEAILCHIKENGGSRRKELADMLGIKETQCTWILGKLVKQGSLQRIGGRYYLTEEVGNEKQRSEKILAYLEEKKEARSEELATLLNIWESSLKDATKALIEEEKLAKRGRLYTLLEK